MAAGDELWENYLAEVQARAAMSLLEGNSPKTAVAEHIIDSSARWNKLVMALYERFIADLCGTQIADEVARDAPGTDSPSTATPGIESDRRLTELIFLANSTNTEE